MEITITENVTNALIAGTSTTVTLSYVGVQGPPGTVGTAAYATNAGTSVFATNADTSVFANTSGTATYATNAGTSVFSTTSGTATYATNAGSALTSGTATYATTSGTAVNISGTILASQVVDTAAILDANTFTGKQTLPASTTSAAPLNIGAGTAPTSPVNGDVWITSIGTLQYRGLSITNSVATRATNVFSNKQTFAPSTTSNASVNLADGTAPTSPATGDLYAVNGSMIYQSSLGAQTLAYLSSNITGNAATAGTATYATNAGTAVNISGTIAATQVTGTAAVLTSANTFTTGEQVIKVGADATRGLTIWRNSTSQTADLLAILSSTGATTLAAFGPTGALTVSPSSGASAASAASITAASSASLANIGLSVYANSGGGFGDVARFYNTNAALFSGYNSSAQLFVRSNGSIYNAAANISTGSDSLIGAVIRGNSSSQTADLQQWQASAGTVLGGRNAAGQTYAGSTTSQVGSTTTTLTSAAYTSSTVAVFTYGGTSLVQVGQTVTVAGVTGGAYNGTWVVSAVTSTTFTVLGSGFTNNAGTGGTFTLSAVASFTAGTAAITPLVVKGAASQSANYQEWQTSAGAAFCTIFGGGLNHTGRIDLGGSLRLGSQSQSFGGGAGGLLAMANATTVPSTNPTGGGILYAEGGALKWRGSSGTVTTIAAA